MTKNSMTGLLERAESNTSKKAIDSKQKHHIDTKTYARSDSNKSQGNTIMMLIDLVRFVHLQWCAIATTSNSVVLLSNASPLLRQPVTELVPAAAVHVVAAAGD